MSHQTDWLHEAELSANRALADTNHQTLVHWEHTNLTADAQAAALIAIAQTLRVLADNVYSLDIAIVDLTNAVTNLSVP